LFASNEKHTHGTHGRFKHCVPFGHPDFAKLFRCGCTLAEREQRRREELTQLSNLGSFADKTFATFDHLVPGIQAAYLRALVFARRPAGWLTLLGPYGCGKTHLAAAIAHEVLAHDVPVLFVVVPDLLDHLRATFRPDSQVSYDERFELVRTVALLVLDDLGTESGTATELPPVVFPAMIGRASRSVVGAIKRVESIDHAGSQWWTGEDALLAPSPITFLAQERLHDPVFITALVRGALQHFGQQNGAMHGYCVTGLPATWASDADKAKLLGEHLRAAHASYSGIRVIPEPLGLVYAVALDNHGQVVGDSALLNGTVGVVDVGHDTVDIAVLRKLVPVPTSLDTYARPLQQIKSQLSAAFERELTLFESDLAVRHGEIVNAGRAQVLPSGWDRPLVANGEAIAARLVEAWGSGAQLDVVLVGGGGAELPQLTAALQARFPHTQIVAQPQTAVARGYARLARRLGQAK
jgi:hypothetical protein